MNKERQRSILEILLKRKQATVRELASLLYISEPSIRRDLAELESKQLIKRVHGGAVLNENASNELRIPFLIRELEQSNEKLIIAKKAASLVTDGNVIFMDASTTAYNMLPFLAEKRDITIITNGLKILNAICDNKEYKIKVVATGGDLHPSCLAFVGEDARSTIKKYNADVCFFACRGLSEDGRLTDISPDEDNVRLKMIEHSKSSYLLCTAEKIGKLYHHNICHISEINGAIFAEEPCEALKKYSIL